MFSASREIWYRLSPVGDLFGISCDEQGIFLGGVPLLKRIDEGKDAGKFAPRSLDELNLEFSVFYGLSIEMSGKASGLRTVTDALNRGELALAKIAAVQLQLPDIPRFEKSARLPESAAKLAFLLRRSGILKEDWDPAEHPRWPAGSPGGIGGEFAPADGSPYDISVDDASDDDPGDNFDDSSSQQLAISPECEEEWSYAERRCDELLNSPSFGTSGRLGFGRSFEQCVRGMVSERCGGNPVG